MLLKIFQNILYLSLFFNILSCSGNPEMRSLPGPSPLPIDSIRLNNTMGVEDFKKVYKAVNRTGKLNSLESWFTRVADEDLKKIAEIASHELYETAFDSKKLVQILFERNSHSGFTDWKEKNPIKADRYQSIFWGYLTNPEFANLFQEHTAFLELDFQRLVQLLPDWANQYAFRLSVNETETDKVKLAKEIRSLLSNKEFKKEALLLSNALSENGKFERLIQAFRSNSETTPKSFLAFSSALASLSENQLQELLEAIKFIDAKPDGLFSVADSYLKKNPGYRRSVAREFQPYLTDVFINNTVESLLATGTNPLSLDLILTLPRKENSDAPTAAFTQTMLLVKTALQNNFTLGDRVQERFEPVLNLYAYLLTRTLESVAKTNLQTLNTKPENFWKSELVLEKVKIVLSNSTTGELNAQIQKDFESLGMQKEAELLKPLLFNKEIFPSNLYVVSTESGNTTLQETLRLGMKKTFELKPIVEPGVILNMLLTRVDFASLERSDNVLTLIHKVVAGLSVNELDTLDNLLFHKLELHNFTPDRLELIFEMYGTREDLKQKLSKLFRCLTLLHEFHHKGYDGVSGLALPWTYLNELGPVEKNVNVFNLFFSTLRESGLFKVDTSTPELKKVFRNPNTLAKYLYAFSQFSYDEQETFTHKFKNLHFGKNWEMFERLAAEPTRDFDAILKSILEEGVFVFPTEKTITEKERNWLILFSQTEDFKAVVRIFNQYGSRTNFNDIVRDLKGLSASGDLARALDYLARIQNERMRKLALTLLEMDKSKQFQELLKFLNSLN